jgi:hypothetical protein
MLKHLSLRAVALFAASCCLPIAAIAAETASVTPLAQAHAHNDYEHDRPLLDALDHGFSSVEADIYLIDGALLVAHNRSDVKPERTLQRLYLDPLRERVQANGGSVYPGGKPFYLLIDIKTDGQAAYAALDKVLAEYDDVITSVHDGKLEPKAISVAISGDCPREMITAAKHRYAGIDGRLTDLDSDVPAHLMPLISDRWGAHFKWRGRGAISEMDRGKLQQAVDAAHAHGRRIRFWATPETIETWTVLQAAGADHINTDNLAGLEAFLRKQQANP